MTTTRAAATITFENVENTPETMSVGTRVARRHPTQGDRLGTVTGWSSDGGSLAVEWDNGGSTVSPASFRTYALVIEAPAAMTTNRIRPSDVYADAYYPVYDRMIAEGARVWEAASAATDAGVAAWLAAKGE